jgi:hypothetical protein
MIKMRDIILTSKKIRLKIIFSQYHSLSLYMSDYTLSLRAGTGYVYI